MTYHEIHGHPAWSCPIIDTVGEVVPSATFKECYIDVELWQRARPREVDQDPKFKPFFKVPIILKVFGSFNGVLIREKSATLRTPPKMLYAPLVEIFDHNDRQRDNSLLLESHCL